MSTRIVPDITLLKKCDTKEKVEQYFIDNDIADYSNKIESLRLASNTSEFNFFNAKNISEEDKYLSILEMFLDDEFRFYRGIY